MASNSAPIILITGVGGTAAFRPIVARLKRDPQGWYTANRIAPPAEAFGK